MGHFVVGVIVPADAEITSHVEEVLAPYSENLRVKPYLRGCYCVGRAAMEKVTEKVNKKFPHSQTDDFRQQLWAEHRERETALGRNPTDDQRAELDAWSDRRWQELTKDHFAAHDAYQKAVKAKTTGLKKANPKCETCKGSGKEKTTYNPDSKWDWYVVGGRWDKYFNDFEWTMADRNAAPAAAVLERLENDPKYYPPFGFVTADGKWVEKGEMGWFGMTSNEKEVDDWRKLAIKTLKNAPKGAYVVAVDCHI